jgi:hypothetical protein
MIYKYGYAPKCWSITGCNDSSIRVSKQCLVRKYCTSVILKIVLFSIWVPIFEEKKSKSQEFIPGSAGEDRGIALLRRQHARLAIGVCVREVGISLERREWIRVDYITYY